jgi:hypothetical protein
MLGHHQLGSTCGIESGLRNLCAAIDVADPCDQLHPDTLPYPRLLHLLDSDK